jgi:hypothetical protein
VPAAEGAAPAAVFDTAEKDALRPLPGEPFVLATWAAAKIGPDIHTQAGRVLYSVPWQHIGKTADVRITGTMVQFFIGGQLIKTPTRSAASRPTSPTSCRDLRGCCQAASRLMGGCPPRAEWPR